MKNTLNNDLLNLEIDTEQTILTARGKTKGIGSTSSIQRRIRDEYCREPRVLTLNASEQWLQDNLTLYLNLSHFSLSTYQYKICKQTFLVKRKCDTKK